MSPMRSPPSANATLSIMAHTLRWRQRRPRGHGRTGVPVAHHRAVDGVQGGGRWIGGVGPSGQCTHGLGVRLHTRRDAKRRKVAHAHGQVVGPKRTRPAMLAERAFPVVEQACIAAADDASVRPKADSANGTAPSHRGGPRGGWGVSSRTRWAKQR